MASTSASGSETSSTPDRGAPVAGKGAREAYYVVRMSQDNSVCVVRAGQLHPSEGGQPAIGASCQVERGQGGETQGAIVVGVGSETAAGIIESYLKTATTLGTDQPPPATSDKPPPATSDKPPPATSDKPPPATSDKPPPATSSKQSVATPTGSKQDSRHRQPATTSASSKQLPATTASPLAGRDGRKGSAGASELAALLSPSVSLSPTKQTLTAKPPERLPFKLPHPQKRPVTTESPVAKRKKIEAQKSPMSRRPAVVPTVVPVRPQGVRAQQVREDKPALTLATSSPRRLTREIDPPPRVMEKSDAFSQILRELHELKRSYSALAGSLLVVRRNQEDIKTRLMEIGISIVSNSSNPLLLSVDSAANDDSVDLDFSLEQPILGADPDVDDLSQTNGESLPHSDGLVMGDPAHPHTLQGIDLAASFPEFDPEYLAVTRGKSCSRRNFAVNLVRYMFTTEEMARSNCSGTRGKARLEGERMAAVKRATFVLWPMASREEEKGEWGKCIYSIDEACRRLNRPKIKKKGEGAEDRQLPQEEAEVEQSLSQP